MSNQANLEASPPLKPPCVPTPGYWSTLHHPSPPTNMPRSLHKGCESNSPKPPVLRLRGGGPTKKKGPCCQEDCPLQIDTMCEICGHNVCFVDWVKVRGKNVCEHCSNIPENPAQYLTVSEVLCEGVQGGGVIEQVQAEDDVQPIFGGHVGQDGEGLDSHHDGDVELGDGVPALLDDSPIEPDKQEDTLLKVLLSTFGHSKFRSKEQEEAVRCVLGREEDVFISMPTGKTLHV